MGQFNLIQYSFFLQWIQTPRIIHPRCVIPQVGMTNAKKNEIVVQLRPEKEYDNKK